MRGRLQAALAALDPGMHDQHRHVVLLAIGRRALARQAAVAAQQLAVVGSEDHDGLVGEREPVELLQKLHDLLVDVADGVEIVVLAHPHAALLLRDQARQDAIGGMIDAMRRHAVGRVERLLPRPLQRDLVPLLLVERVVGRIGDFQLGLDRLPRRLAGRVGVHPHDVVRIDQVDREIPGLTLVGHRPALGFQPLDRLRRHDLVVLVAALGAFDEVAGSGVVVETVVAVHHGLEQRLDVVGPVLRRHGAVQVPLALVGGVVAELAQDLADGRQLGIEALHVGQAGIVEDAVLRRVQARIDHRARGRAHVGCDLVVLQIGAGAAQPLVSRQRHGPARPHILLLVGQDEEDVVAAVAGARRLGRRERRFRSAGDRRLGLGLVLGQHIARHGGAGQSGGAGAEKVSPRRVGFGHP